MSEAALHSRIRRGRRRDARQGDLTYFIIYHLEVIRKALRQLNEYLQRKSKELQELDKLVRKKIGSRREFNDRQIRLLEEAVRRPGRVFTIDEHRSRSRVSYLTARSDLERLVKVGAMKKRQSGTRSLYTTNEKFLARLGLASAK